MTTSVCSVRELSKSRDNDVSNSSRQWIQKWFLKSRGPVCGLLKPYYLFWKHHPHRGQTKRHSLYIDWKKLRLSSLWEMLIVCERLCSELGQPEEI